MDKMPFSLPAVALIGGVLGTLNTINGLHGRLFGSFWVPGGGHPLAATLLNRVVEFQTDPILLGWPMVVLGCAWYGGLSALWLRQGWGYPTTVVVAFLSLTLGGWMSLLAGLTLALLILPPTRRWWKAEAGG